MRAGDNGRPPLRSKKRVSFACEAVTIIPKTTTIAPKTTTIIPKTTTVSPKMTTLAPKLPQPQSVPAENNPVASNHRRRMSMASRKRYMR